jgi:ankyrin repeat protein
MNAANKGHVQVVELLIRVGACIDSFNDDGETSLMKAALEGRLSIVKTLLDHGADLSISAKVISSLTHSRNPQGFSLVSRQCIVLCNSKKSS